MIHEVIGIGRAHRVSIQSRVHPRCAAHGAVVPKVLGVVVDHVLVDHRGVGRAVKPPDLVEALVGARKELILLVEVYVVVDVLAQIAAQRLDPTVIAVELVHAHPVRHVGRNDGSVYASNRDVVAQKLCAPDVRRSEVLQRVQRCVGVDQNLLSRLNACANLRAMRQPRTTSLIGCRRRPVHHRFLISPANEHRVHDSLTQRCAAHGNHKPTHIRDDHVVDHRRHVRRTRHTRDRNAPRRHVVRAGLRPRRCDQRAAGCGRKIASAPRGVAHVVDRAHREAGRQRAGGFENDGRAVNKLGTGKRHHRRARNRHRKDLSRHTDLGVPVVQRAAPVTKDEVFAKVVLIPKPRADQRRRAHAPRPRTPRTCAPATERSHSLTAGRHFIGRVDRRATATHIVGSCRDGALNRVAVGVDDGDFKVLVEHRRGDALVDFKRKGARPRRGGVDCRAVDHVGKVDGRT